MSLLYVDIETIGTTDADIIADIAKSITPPKNYSKPDTLAKWEAEDKPALVLDAVAKTSFDGGLGRIVVIGYAFGDNDVYADTGADERWQLHSFFDSIDQGESPTTIVGHNITWDLRFMYQRCVVHNLPPSPILLKAMHSKPWDACIADTMTMWNPERDKKISLEKLCKILGVPTSKGDITGATVWEAYRKGRIDEIAQYCKGDVEATRQCYKRLTWS